MMAPKSICDASWHANTQLCRSAELGDGARRTNDGLGGHAAPVEAVAAQQVALDQGRLAAHAGRGDGADQAGCARADHYQVIAPLGARVFVLRRVHVKDQARLNSSMGGTVTVGGVG